MQTFFVNNGEGAPAPAVIAGGNAEAGTGNAGDNPPAAANAANANPGTGTGENANGEIQTETGSSTVLNHLDFLNQAANAGSNPLIANGVTANDSTLRHEEHLRYDERLLMIARQRLNGIADLRAHGLVMNLGGLGTMLSMYERSGDMTAASINMDGMTDAQKDRVTYDEVGVPVPIFHKDWSINIRQLEASRTRGEPLSTTQIGIATRIVTDSMESALFNGIPNFVYDGKQVYGYTNFPHRNTVTLTASWATANGSQIVSDVKRMLQAAYNDDRFGPFTLYVAKDIWANIQEDYSTEKGDNTIMDRIEAFRDVTMVKPGDYLPAGNVVLVQMTDDVVDMVVGQDIVNIQWMTNPMQTIYKVYSCCAPRIKADRNNSCGVVHGSV